jgi:hypothetical protein
VRTFHNHREHKKQRNKQTVREILLSRKEHYQNFKENLMNPFTSKHYRTLFIQKQTLTEEKKK